MKRIIILCALVALTTTAVVAKPLDSPTALAIAKNLWSQVAKTPFQLEDVTPLMEFNHLYIFANPNGNGFIVLPADDCATPLLAFSVSNAFPASNLPPHVKSWLQSYDDQVRQLVALGATADKSVAEEWERLKNNQPLGSDAKASVSPLLSTVWDQAPLYNNLCPRYDGEHLSVTGCSATATAQIMKYWNHPRTGVGSHTYVDTLSDIQVFDTLSADFAATTYDWEHMPNTLSSSSSDTEILAVATLMFHVGVAIEMDYGSSSGAYTNSYGFFNWGASENALKYYFKYNSQLRGVEKNHVSNSEWLQLLKNDLNAGLPILYSGEDRTGGHAFVCDGYNSLSRFHFNWGWGGSYDGYYAIGNLNPSYSFNINNMAILGICPDTLMPPVAHIEALASDSLMGVVTGGGNVTPYHDTVTLVAAAKEGYRFQRWDDYNIYTPRSFMPNNDQTLTALFEPLVSDSVTYSFDLFFSRCSKDKFYDYFAMRVPAASLASCRNLSSIQMYDGFSGSYQLLIYQGGSQSPQTLLHSQTFETHKKLKWLSVPIDSALSVDASQPLWVVVHPMDTASWPPVSYFSGNYDGAWFSFDGVNWQHSWGSHPFSWMLRALFSPRDPYTFNVVATSSADSLGTVTGAGQFLEGDTAVLSAVAAEGYRFHHWSNGSTLNPLTFEVRSDTTLTAFFVKDVGINTIEQANLVLRPNPAHDLVAIEGVNVLRVEVIDVVGRVVAQFRGSNIISLGSLPPAIYTLRISTPKGSVIGKAVKR